MSYTKGKWEIESGNDDNGEWYYAGPAKISFGYDCFGKEGKEALAIAKRIVRCVNNYDGLVEALKEIAKDGCPADIEIAKQTLAKTEEE